MARSGSFVRRLRNERDQLASVSGTPDDEHVTLPKWVHMLWTAGLIRATASDPNLVVTTVGPAR